MLYDDRSSKEITIRKADRMCASTSSWSYALGRKKPCYLYARSLTRSNKWRDDKGETADFMT